MSEDMPVTDDSAGTRRSGGAVCWTDVTVGLVTGLVIFALLNWIAQQWLAPGAAGQPGLYTVLAGVVGAAAAAAALLRPQVGIAAGMLMVLFVALGLLTGTATDISSPGGGWDPLSIVQHGAHQPVVAGCAASVLVVSALSLHRRWSH